MTSDKKPKDLVDFMKEKIAELKEDELFDAVKTQYPHISTREIMQGLSILLGGDVIYDESDGSAK